MSSPMTLTEVASQMAEEFRRGMRVAIYEPKKIIRSGDVTVVIWADNSKTIVRRDPEDIDNIHAAFCAALAKKVYGSNSQIKKVIERNMPKDKHDIFHEKVDRAIRHWKHKHSGQEPSDEERREIYKEYMHIL